VQIRRKQKASHLGGTEIQTLQMGKREGRINTIKFKVMKGEKNEEKKK